MTPIASFLFKAYFKLPQSYNLLIPLFLHSNRITLSVYNIQTPASQLTTVLSITRIYEGQYLTFTHIASSLTMHDSNTIYNHTAAYCIRL